MRKLSTIAFLLLGLFVVAAPAQEAVKEKLKFTVAQPKKDSKFTNAGSTQVNLDIDVAMNGQSMMQMAMKSEEKNIVERTVLATGEKGITKMRYTLKQFENSQKMEMMGQNQDTSESDARLGGTYIVELKEGKLAITDAEGAAVGAEISEAFEAECSGEVSEGRLYDPHARIDKIVGGKELAIDEVINMDEQMVKDFMKDAGDQMEEVDLKIEKATLTLVRKVTYLGTDCGVFKADIKLVGSGEGEGMGMNMGIEMQGEFFVGINNSFVYKIDLGGPMSMTGGQSSEEGEIAMNGKGTMKHREDVVISQPKAE